MEILAGDARDFPLGRSGVVDMAHFKERVAPLLQAGGDVRDERGRIAVLHVIEIHERRDAHADAVRTHHAVRGIDHLEEEARAVGDRAAVGVGAVVHAVAQKLVDQVAVRPVHEDGIEAGGLGVHRGLAEDFHNAGNLVGAQRTRHRVTLLAFRRLDGVALRRLVRGRNGLRPMVEIGMRRATRMPELHRDATARGVHGVGHAPPAGDVRWAVEAGFLAERARVARHHRRLGKDDTGRRPLPVILDEQVAGDVLRTGTNARERSHQDAIRERQRAHLQRREKIHGNAQHSALR